MALLGECLGTGMVLVTTRSDWQSGTEGQSAILGARNQAILGGQNRLLVSPYQWLPRIRICATLDQRHKLRIGDQKPYKSKGVDRNLISKATQRFQNAIKKHTSVNIRLWILTTAGFIVNSCLYHHNFRLGLNENGLPKNSL